MSEDVTVKIPKAMVDHIQKQPWFKTHYHDLDDFVMDAVRRLKENYMRTRAK